MADGFLGRWSQRKQALREGRAVDEPVAPQRVAATEPAALPVPACAQQQSANQPEHTPAKPVDALPAAAEKAPAPAPTLADVQALNADSSFAPFVARDVAPEVRNAAMKKLFADPHYNVMDGLDIYIDDYSVPSPMPAAMLRQMASAKFLKLFDDEEKPQNSTQDQDTDHDHTDLRLQPDHTARPTGFEREPERAPDPAFEPVPPPSR